MRDACLRWMRGNTFHFILETRSSAKTLRGDEMKWQRTLYKTVRIGHPIIPPHYYLLSYLSSLYLAVSQTWARLRTRHIESFLQNRLIKVDDLPNGDSLPN